MAGDDNGPPEAETTAVTGRLVKVRKLSSRLAFADLVLAADDREGNDRETVELVVKECPSLPSVKAALKVWKLRDVVSVPGSFEEERDAPRGHRTFRCSGLPVVVDAWDVDARGAFVPVFTMVCRPCGGGGAPPGNGPATRMDEVCKYYVSQGRCPLGPSCPRVHTDDPAARREWLAERRRRAVAVERAVVGGPPLAKKKTVSKARRAEAFADFLVEKFRLDSDSLVLDVAGGRGDLCFELSALRGVPCVSVDPRGRKLSKRQRRFRKGWEGGGRSEWGGHIRSLFHADFFDSPGDDENGGGERGDLLERITVIAGLHPDEATEHIADCALRNRVPFAIVPCCVFPLSGGSMSFGDWCDYLQGKDGRIRRDYISCEGKNLVLHCAEL